jgi:HlyD family secretion protein
VLAVNEGNLIFEGNAIYVEVETGQQQYEKRRIETGLSDGINIEVVSGLKPGDRFKQL